jgi:hypothetical protein
MVLKTLPLKLCFCLSKPDMSVHAWIQYSGKEEVSVENRGRRFLILANEEKILVKQESYGRIQQNPTF